MRVCVCRCVRARVCRCVRARVCVCMCESKRKKVIFLRDSDFKDVVLDQLLPQHDDAELDAQLDEAASWRTLRETRAL